MPIVDLNSKKIYGCKKNTRSYFHEKGHLIFNDSEFGVKINYYGSFFQMIAVFFLALGVVIDNFFVSLFGFINASGIIICYLIEEIWCDLYSFKQIKLRNK